MIVAICSMLPSLRQEFRRANVAYYSAEFPIWRASTIAGLPSTTLSRHPLR